jgi:hypothetical protein
MLCGTEMFAKARLCEEMADKASDAMIAHSLHEAARHWRTMAIQLHLLEQHQAYRIIRDRKDG